MTEEMTTKIQKPIPCKEQDLIEHLKYVGHIIIEDAEIIGKSPDKTCCISINAVIEPTEVTKIRYTIERIADPRVRKGEKMIDIGKDLQNAFDDGYKARDAEIIRCKDCKHGRLFAKLCRLQTNADRIRAMSDDVDLALFLDDVRNDGFFKGQEYPYSIFGWLDWLKQEVNDGN